MTGASSFGVMVRLLEATYEGALPDVPDALAKQLCHSLDTAIQHLGDIDAVKAALRKMQSNMAQAMASRGIEQIDPLDPIKLTNGLEHLSIPAWVTLNTLSLAVKAVNESATEDGASMLVSKLIAKANRFAQGNTPNARPSGRPVGSNGQKKLTKRKISDVRKDPDFKSYADSDSKNDLRKKIMRAHGITQTDFYKISSSKKT